MTSAAFERPEYAANFQLPALLDGWLDAIVAHYQEIEVPLPARQYWMIGSSAHDCEQVVISVQQMFLGTATDPTAASVCTGPRSLTFTVEVVRCTPTVDSRGRSPQAEAIEAAAVDPVIDMEILLDLTRIFDPDMTGLMATVDVIPPEGGVHGAIASYTVTLLP